MAGVEVNGYTIEPGANLVDANLAGTDLSGTNLREVYLLGANADEDTRWPDGFRVRAAGAGVIFH